MSQQTSLIAPWLLDMNVEQVEAINHQDGPCVLMAVAGAGKTRAIVHRIARMVAQGIPAKRICAVTFAKKAADEMNERLDRLGVEGARVGTWHSLCLEILQKGFSQWAKWNVGEDGDGEYLLSEALGYRHLDWKDADKGEVKRYITKCKANLCEPGSAGAAGIARKMTGPGHVSEQLQRAYKVFQVLVEERGVLLFDDFLLFTYRFLSVEQNRLDWAGHWHYFLHDEANDENVAQRTIAEMLTREHRNYMTVGDCNQAIFGFRGSDPEHLAAFEQEWGARKIVMNRNYRSGRAIVTAANAIIRTGKYALDMVAERTTEGEVRVDRNDDPEEEGEALANLVEETLQRGGGYQDVVALYRQNSHSRALEEALLKRRIPYVVAGGVSFYQRREVRDLLAYLRVATGRDVDSKSVKRCINTPFRYLGKAFVEKVEDELDERTTVMEAVERAAKHEGIQARQRASADEWAGIILKLQQQHEAGTEPGAMLLWLINATKYLAWLTRDQGEESVETSHVANVRELLRVAERFDDAAALLDYVDETEKAGARQRRAGHGGDRVLLMTIHKSKGLEWPVVFVAGCNEKLIPHVFGDLEEERRLMYVAATRAKDLLVLSYLRRFARADGTKPAEPSRFLVEAGLVGGAKEDPGTLLDPCTCRDSAEECGVHPWRT